MVTIFGKVVKAGGELGRFVVSLPCETARLLKRLGDRFVVSIRFPGCQCWVRLYASIWISRAGCYLYLGRRLAPMLEEVWRTNGFLELELPISRDELVRAVCREKGCREPRHIIV